MSLASTVPVGRCPAAINFRDQSAAKGYADWPDGAFKGGGLAGLALGIQDRKK